MRLNFIIKAVGRYHLLSQLLTQNTKEQKSQKFRLRKYFRRNFLIIWRSEWILLYVCSVTCEKYSTVSRNFDFWASMGESFRRHISQKNHWKSLRDFLLLLRIPASEIPVTNFTAPVFVRRWIFYRNSEKKDLCH